MVGTRRDAAPVPEEVLEGASAAETKRALRFEPAGERYVRLLSAFQRDAFGA